MEGPGLVGARRAGALGALVWLGILWLASGLIAASFPPAAAADRLIRLTPGTVATFFIEALGHWAMRLLTVATLAAFAAAGAEAFHRTARAGRHRAIVASAVMLVLGAVAAAVDPSAIDPGATAVALVAASVGYGVVASAAFGARPDDATAGFDADRRRVLRMGVGGALGVAAAAGAAGWIVRRLTGPNTDVALVAPAQPATVPDREPFPDIDGLTPEITSAADHYVVDIDLIAPTVEATEWTLDVFGAVDTPLALTFDELQTRYTVVEEFSVLTCISNEVGGALVGNSAWGGVRMRDVLKDAGVKPEGVELILRAADGYSDSFPVALAMEPDVLLAISQNGRPLTQDHGFPCRVRIPRLYGMENVKWLRSIEVVGRDYAGYWQQRGWKDVAVVKTSSRIDVAGDDGVGVHGRPTWIAGVAWAGVRGISKVEVSTDGGRTWTDARLKQPVSPNAWTQWAYRWTPERSGRFDVACRATDGDGDVQVDERTAPHPAGATGHHVVTVEVT